ncbi:MAG: hypothetical protein BSOLF_2807 [Candidatus Carbobacillus altaicus]|uniref:PIG-L family deacetylase n=1 Tax=Candidatus Carbonibacillus altaicus TaxID=2163959 RepID=A0A2R6Y1U9_9BACL|nr:MAG: hypothetical protein BSOLF_2807 [Candidatus Carbobacillus altaicus]
MRLESGKVIRSESILKKRYHIMAIGAHCGDMELVAGGVIAKYT